MKISIITVTYNSASTLEKTIESIKGQSAFNEIEYILIDGKSTDNTVELLKQNSKYIKKWISEPDNGIYDAMNKGASLASGDWVGFLHADDVLASNTIIEEMIDILKSNSINVLYGNLNYVSGINGEKVVRQWKSNVFNKDLLKKGWMPPHPTLYLNRHLFWKIGGFDTQFRIAADYDYILRLFTSPEIKSFFMDKLMVKMRVGGVSNRSISNIIMKSKEDYRALKKNQVGGLRTLLFKNICKLSQFRA